MRSQYGYLWTAAHFELVSDNILDLSHIEFLHTGTLGTNMIRHTETHAMAKGNTFFLIRMVQDEILPRFMEHNYGTDRRPVRRTLSVRWDAPVLMVGTYTHVSDQWAVIYDQPVLLNERQAGVAIEGALKQKVCELQRLAVDTHGFTYFAMAAAKLLGFDLAPRLADLASRKLHLPHHVAVPPGLEAMVERIGISRAARQAGTGCSI